MPGQVQGDPSTCLTKGEIIPPQAPVRTHCHRTPIPSSILHIVWKSRRSRTSRVLGFKSHTLTWDNRPDGILQGVGLCRHDGSGWLHRPPGHICGPVADEAAPAGCVGRPKWRARYFARRQGWWRNIQQRAYPLATSKSKAGLGGRSAQWKGQTSLKERAKALSFPLRLSL